MHDIERGSIAGILRVLNATHLLHCILIEVLRFVVERVLTPSNATWARKTESSMVFLEIRLLDETLVIICRHAF
jgi:hypothetical protein